MAKENKVEVQKGPIAPRDPMSENYKNMTRSECDSKDARDRHERRSGQEMKYHPTESK